MDISTKYCTNETVLLYEQSKGLIYGKVKDIKIDIVSHFRGTDYVGHYTSIVYDVILSDDELRHAVPESQLFSSKEDFIDSL